jgi:hypothetical protein
MTLHREITREALACDQMKPKPLDRTAEKPKRAPRSVSDRRLKQIGKVLK